MMSGDQPGEHGGGWPDTIPAQLRARDQWVVTEDKKPVAPQAGWNDPSKQFGFEEALPIARANNWELAFALRKDDPFIVIDFDHVGPTSELSETIHDWIDELETYTEVSRSGNGLHLIGEGTKLPGRLMNAQLDEQGSVEVFDAGQYVVLTGKSVGPTDEITPGGDDLLDFQRAHLRERGERPDKGSTRCKSTEELDLEAVSTTSVSVGQRDIRRTIREYATDGSSSARRALRLWDSTAGSDDRYDSASEADLALCSDLAFWCQEDARLMDRCFRRSSRHREKWDEVHYSDGRTYGEGTIQVAIDTNYETYSVDRYVVWE